jgi:hypothetical protein
LEKNKPVLQIEGKGVSNKVHSSGIEVELGEQVASRGSRANACEIELKITISLNCALKLKLSKLAEIFTCKRLVSYSLLPLRASLQELLESALLEQTHQVAGQSLAGSGRDFVDLSVLLDITSIDHLEFKVVSNLGVNQHLDQDTYLKEIDKLDK